MRTVITGVLAFSALFTFQSCSNEQARFVDLNTGRPFELIKHPKTGLMVDAETGKPLNIFVDTQTQDTIYGRTGEVINGRVTKVAENYYAFAQAAAAAANSHVAVVVAEDVNPQPDVHFSAQKENQ